MDSLYGETRTKDKKAEAYWTFLVEKLWRHIGVEVTRDVMQKIFPISTLEFLLKDLKYEMIGLAGVPSVFSTLFIIFGDMFHIRSNLFVIFRFIVVSTIFSLLIGGPKYIQVRNLLQELYPDR
jgi:hypothetical protein